MHKKILHDTFKIIAQLKEKKKRVDLEVKLLQRVQQRITRSLQKSLDDKFIRDVSVYSNFMKAGWPSSATEFRKRRIEKSLLIQAAKYAARQEGKKSSQFSIPNLIDSLMMSSDHFDDKLKL